MTSAPDHAAASAEHEHTNAESSPTDVASTQDHLSSDSSSTRDTNGVAQQPHEKDGFGEELEPTKSQGTQLGRKKIAVIMTALCIALFLAALDMTIITTALPTIAEHFHASQSGYTWIGSAYLLSSAATVPVWGKVSDIFGRKPIILVANIIFLVGSLICALAVNIGMLLVGRAIQGLASGGLVVLVNICISDLFSMRERAIYYALVGMTWAIASAVGPILGGVFTEKVSWRWCFYINLPFDGLAFVILLFFLKIETPTTPFWAGIAAIDWVGSLTIVGGTVMFLLGLEYGGTSFAWDSATVLCLIIFGIVVFALFFVNEWKFAKYPVIPLEIFNNVSNVATLCVCFCHGFVFIASTYFLPLYFQTIIGASPILSGCYTFALVVPLSVGSAITGIIIRKTGRYRELIYGGMILMTLGVGLLIDLKPYASWPRIIIFQIILGFGVGPNFQAPLIALQSNTAPRQIAAATATFAFVRQMATAISVVLGGVVYSNMIQRQVPSIRAKLGDNIAANLESGSLGGSTEFIKSLSPAAKKIVDAALTSSLQKMWIFYTCMAVIGIFATVFVGVNILSKEHETTKTGLEEVEKGRAEREAAKKGNAAAPEGNAENGA